MASKSRYNNNTSEYLINIIKSKANHFTGNKPKWSFASQEDISVYTSQVFCMQSVCVVSYSSEYVYFITNKINREWVET